MRWWVWGVWAVCMLVKPLHATQTSNCQDFWDKRDEKPLAFPSESRCPSIYALLIDHALKNGRAHEVSYETLLSWTRKWIVWPQKEKRWIDIEKSLLKHNSSQAEHWLKLHKPRTVEGWIFYAKHMRKTIPPVLLSHIVNFWVKTPLKRDDQALFLKIFHEHLSVQDHRKRLLHQWLMGQRESVQALMEQVPTLRVTRLCFKRLQGQEDGDLLKNFPKNTTEFVCLLTQTVENLLSEGRKNLHIYREKALQAYQTLEAYDRKPLEHILPLAQEKLQTARMALVRALIVHKEHRKAYKVLQSYRPASEHEKYKKYRYQGWLSLAFLNKPRQALHFFEKALHHVGSLEKGVTLLFWLGETHQELGNQKQAQSFWRKAAGYDQFFYGQQSFLALYPQGKGPPQPLVPIHMIKTLKLTEPQEKRLLGMLHTLVLLKNNILGDAFLNLLKNHKIKLNTKKARTFLKFLGEQGSPYMRVQGFDKLLSCYGYVRMPRQAYPIFSVPEDVCSDIPHALWLGLTRKESSFNSMTRGSCGEYGLMQLMPQTAQEVGEQKKQNFEMNDLLEDPTLNVHLGCSHLALGVKKFSDASFLSIPAYNAGIGRIEQWLQLLDGPHQPPMSWIHWVESIPIDGTREYIKSVLSNTQMYYKLKTGKFSSEPFHVTSFQESLHQQKGSQSLETLVKDL